eukprot:jgi/Ulvmu1/5478/UM023_0014.1
MAGMDMRTLAILIGAIVVWPFLVKSIGYEVTHCECYDYYSNFYARANDMYKNAIADRRNRERPDMSRAALRQIQTEMLAGRDPAVNAGLAKNSLFICQAWYDSMANTTSTNTTSLGIHCGVPRIKFLWSYDGMDDVSICDWAGVECCTDNTMHPIMVHNPARRTATDAQVVAAHGEGLSFTWNPKQQNRPWIGVYSALHMDQVQPDVRAAIFAGYPPTCKPEHEFSIRALDLAGYGLEGNLSQGSWMFLRDLPHLMHLDISDNGALVGDFPATLSTSLESISATGTGLALATMGRLVPVDEWTSERTSIFSISTGQDGHETVSSTGRPFLTREHGLLQLLFRNRQPANYPHVQLHSFARKHWTGLNVAGSQYGEILPPWVDSATGRTAISLQGPQSMLLREEHLSHSHSTVRAVLQQDPLQNAMSCDMPVLAHRNPTTGAWATVRLMVHPMYYSYHTEFCRCTDTRNRVAFLARPPTSWLESPAIGGPAPAASAVIPVCLPHPDPDLLKLWVVFPSAMAVLLLIITMQCVSVVASWHKYRASTRRRKSEHSPGWLVHDKNKLNVRDRSDPLRSEVTLVCTDVEGSTAMWEWNSAVMQEAIFIHDKVLRKLIPVYCGAEVMTEGDAFILAFHEETDALLYCLHTQEALLQAPWPPAVLDHENAAQWKASQELSACLADPRYGSMHAHLRERLFARNSNLRQPIFAGLRVRMSMHTDVADVISMHEITQKPLYRGSVYDFAEGLSEFAKGGQVAVSPGTLGRVGRDERRMHRASATLDAALAKGRQSVQRRENAGLDLTTRIIKQLQELRVALGWKERFATPLAFFLLDVGVGKPKQPPPLAVLRARVGRHNDVVDLQDLPVQYYSMVNVYHAYTRDLHLRSLYFDRTAEVTWPTGFFRAPGALEYVLSQRAPFIVSMRIAAEWVYPGGPGANGNSVGRIDSRQASLFSGWDRREAALRRQRYFHELVVQVALIHNGYVSECVWARSKMFAHVLFMLSEEAIAAALSMFAANQLASGRLTLGTPCTVLSADNDTLPRLVLRTSIASSGCDALHPDERTGRLVLHGPLAQMSKEVLALTNSNQLLIDHQSLNTAFPLPPTDQRKSMKSGDRPEPVEGSTHQEEPTLPAADTDLCTVTWPTAAGGEGGSGGTELRFLTNDMPATYRVVRACSMGSFFIIGQNVTELFALTDAYSAERDATKLSWKALTMRVTTALRSTQAALRSFDLVKAKLIDPKPLLHAVVQNLYVETAPLLDE